jgi:hypothetical protein
MAEDRKNFVGLSHNGSPASSLGSRRIMSPVTRAPSMANRAYTTSAPDGGAASEDRGGATSRADAPGGAEGPDDRKTASIGSCM